MKDVLVPINSAGWPFIALFAIISLGAGYIAEPLGWAGAVLTAWCIYFFRDPDRTTPTKKGLIISPADGRVCLIDEAAPPPELEMGDKPMVRVCVFMNVFNVHVNRVPIDGTITKIAYHPGKFFNAELDKASVHNERQSLSLKTVDGKNIAFVQIAGLVARRIVCNASEGQMFSAGERFGLIRFGSRVDVYMPAGTNPQVAVGQTCIAGETVIADLNSSQEKITGETR